MLEEDSVVSYISEKLCVASTLFSAFSEITLLTFTETCTLVVKAVWALNRIWERGHDLQCCEMLSL